MAGMVLVGCGNSPSNAGGPVVATIGSPGTSTPIPPATLAATATPMATNTPSPDVIATAVEQTVTARVAQITPVTPAVTPASPLPLITSNPSPTETPTPTSTPTIPPTPTPAPTATTGPIDMVGRVADDIPGTPLMTGTTVTSILDSHGRQTDVYSVSAKIGQTIKITFQGDAVIRTYPPGTKTLIAMYGQDRCVATCSASFLVGTTGVYYLSVLPFAGDDASRYSLRVDFL